MTKKIIYSLAILFTILFAVPSCKKDAGDKKPDEDIAAAAAGQYEMNYISYDGDGTNLPKGSISGKVYIANKDKNTADMLISVEDSENSSNSESQNFEDIQLKKESSKIALYFKTDKIGTIDDDELVINISDEEGKELIIKARK